MRRLIFVFAIFLVSCNQEIKSPIFKKDFTELTSPDEVRNFVKNASEFSSSINYEVFGTTVKGNELVVAKIKTSNKSNLLRILIFAQQHGNEQSGKEACLVLLQDIANNKLIPITDNLELWIVPQLNPDGGSIDQRINGNDADLNRDHVILSQPETQALRALFQDFEPHVTLDIHEYYPYSKSWEEYGAFKNFDVQVGIPTNFNVSGEIKSFGLNQVLPAIQKHLNDQGYSFQNYIVGPAPNLGRTRHSTVDFDDGRQSFAILNTLSLIYEGLNGKESSLDNIEGRTKAQFEAIIGLLNFLNSNNEQVVKLVNNARIELANRMPGDSVAIRMEHFSDGKPLMMNLISSKSNNDSLVSIQDYHPLVKPTLMVSRPNAYLIPISDSLLLNFLNLHKISFERYEKMQDDIVVSYSIGQIATSIDEELENRYPQVIRKSITNDEIGNEYYVVTTSQLHSNFLVSVFEPQSMLGLAQRKGYEYLLCENSQFPILRIE